VREKVNGEKLPDEKAFDTNCTTSGMSLYLISTLPLPSSRSDIQSWVTSAATTMDGGDSSDEGSTWQKDRVLDDWKPSMDGIRATRPCRWKDEIEDLVLAG
jgi:hypothetical protein